MKHRCPTVHPLGIGVIQGYRLMFSTYATIIPVPSEEVPLLVWEIDSTCESSLDAYEGYPELYRREVFLVKLTNGKTLKAMVYLMNDISHQPPSLSYCRRLQTGYDQADFSFSILEKAMTYTQALLETGD